MSYYIINKNKDNHGYNEVHKDHCVRLPEVQNRVSLGHFSSDGQAVAYARNNGYPNADGCYYCCSSAHRG